MLRRFCNHTAPFWLGALLASFGGLAFGQPAAKTAEWTVLVFMNGDNNLEKDALINFEQMARIGSTDQVNIVVQFDRIAKYAHTTPVDWSQTLRFKIERGTEPQPKQAVADMGELNMGDEKVLADFVKWGIDKYPAKKYFLIIWDHGQGYRLFLNSLLERQRTILASRGFKTNDTLASIRAASVRLRSTEGVASEDRMMAPFRSAPGDPYRSASNGETNKDVLYNKEIIDALKSSLNGRKLDLIGFDACLMAMVKTVYGLRDVATSFVGSEELEPGLGWKYDDFLNRLVMRPDMDGPGLASAIVDSYRDFYARPEMVDQGGDETTLSAFRLGGAGDLASALSKLSDTLTGNLKAELQNIVGARAASATYAPGYEFYHVDLVQFLTELARRSKTPSIVQQSTAIVKLVLSGIIARHAGAKRQGAYGSNGLAIYFPAAGHEYTSDPFAEGGYDKGNQFFPVDFVQHERWADFLHAYWQRVP
jgi:hypothetical protein